MTKDELFAAAGWEDAPAPGSSSIRTAREARGWTQQQVADAIGITLRQYQRYEAGETELYHAGVVTYLSLCYLLDLNAAEFAPIEDIVSVKAALLAGQPAEPQ